jgi:hypothetical protein
MILKVLRREAERVRQAKGAHCRPVPIGIASSERSEATWILPGSSRLDLSYDGTRVGLTSSCNGARYLHFAFTVHGRQTQGIQGEGDASRPSHQAGASSQCL